MLITTLPLELLIANNPAHTYQPSGSSFLGFLKQDVAARIRELEMGEGYIKGNKEFEVDITQLPYPIIEKKLMDLGANIGIIEHAREDHFRCKLYWVPVRREEGSWSSVKPTVSLYTVTPIKKI